MKQIDEFYVAKDAVGKMTAEQASAILNTGKRAVRLAAVIAGVLGLALGIAAVILVT